MVGQLVKTVLPNRPLPILSGPLRGTRWNPHTARLACWFGTYEQAVQDAAVSVLRLGDTVYDIGAFAGFFTLLAARLVGPTGHVHAVEPNGHNRQALQTHLTANPELHHRVTLHAVGITATRGQAAITDQSEHSTLAYGTEVVMSTVDDMPGIPRLIKVDVEGGEIAVLQGASRVFKDVHPAWLVETHNGEIRLECTRLLQQHGYTPTRVTPHHLFAH